ncbi:MAG: amidohydrolase family protein [Planctomycetota bacterium]
MLLRMIWIGILMGAGLLPALSQELTDAPGRFAVRAGWIYTLSDQPDVPALIRNGVLMIDQGRVVEIGADLEIPLGIPVLDFSDEVIMPGLVSAGVDMIPTLGVRESVSAKYRAIDSFDMYADDPRLLSGGVTTVYLNPGMQRLVSGTGAVVKVAGPCSKTRILRDGHDLCVNLGEAAFNPPPLQDYPLPASSANDIPPSKRQRPGSRLGQYAELRAVFASLSKPDALGDGFDYNQECLAATLAGRPVLRIDARRCDDIEGAIRFINGLKMSGYITGAVEAHKALAMLKASGLSVVFEMPIALNRPAPDLGFSKGLLEERIDTPACLASEGIPFALSLPFRERPEDLLLAAAAAVRGGLDPMMALAAITRTPAQILGVSERVGTLVPGKDADFVVLSGKPLMNRTHVVKVFSSGSEVFKHPGTGDATVIRAGKIFTLAGQPALLDGEILVENGKISAIGASVPHPPGAKCIDAGPESVITPGFIDGHSYLGLEGDHSSPATEICPAQAVAVPGRHFQRVAAEGITTVILASRGSSVQGSQLSAIKTAGAKLSELVLKNLVGLKFGFRNQDPVLGAGPLESALQAGKRYDDAWKKYYEDLKKWEEEQAKKASEANQPKEADKAGKTNEDQAKQEKVTPEGTEKTEEGNADKVEEDPITGTWAYNVSGDPLPGPQQGEFKLILTGDVITGTGLIFFTGPEEVAIEGRLINGKIVQMEIDVETPVGKPKVEADLVGKDHMVGEVKLEPYLRLAYDARRTEKKAPVVKVSLRKKKKGDDGRPLPPKVDENLEPFRHLLAREIPALVDVDFVLSIEKIIELFVDKNKLLLGLLGAEEAYKTTERIRGAEVSVVLPPSVTEARLRRIVVPGDELSREGVNVVFQSQAEDGACSLPLLAAYAVHNGMDPEEALKALTIHAARLYKIDDRVGSLEEGKDADLVIFGGDPFEISTPVLRVFISGKEVER